jgi:hypothetical protein
MARIKLLLLALLASSIGVRAKSIPQVHDIRTFIAGKVQTYCENLLQYLHVYLY